jgi:hypothetical protein
MLKFIFLSYFLRREALRGSHTVLIRLMDGAMCGAMCGAMYGAVYGACAVKVMCIARRTVRRKDLSLNGHNQTYGLVLCAVRMLA